MNIEFANGKNYTYLNAYALENDYCKGVKRPSLEIHFPVAEITYAELEEILNDVSNIKEIVLIGDTVLLETGELYTPQNVYSDYDIKGKITIDDEKITVKLFKKSDLEIENEEALATIDELLIAMEV